MPSPPRYSPMLLATGPPGSGDWVVEAKWDGMRALVDTGAGDWRSWSRHGTPITGWFPELAHLEAAVGGRRAVLDGEVICLDDDGRPSFPLLQRRIGHAHRPGRPGQLAFVAFDVLWLDGTELINEPWHERRHRLEELAVNGLVLSPVFDDPDAMLIATRELGLEGAVHKDRCSRYHVGRRTSAWRKAKHTLTSTYVVGGLAWTSRARDVPALLVGDRRPDGLLDYRGAVELAAPRARRHEIVETLQRCTIDAPPFHQPPAHRRARWVAPALVVEVRHTLGRPRILREPVLLRAVRVEPV